MAFIGAALIGMPVVGVAPSPAAAAALAPCPPKPGDSASEQEKQDYGVALYMGCEPLKPKPWFKNNCGIVSCSTYYSRHAVKIINEANQDTSFWDLLKDAGASVACDKIVKKLRWKGSAYWCAGAAFNIALMRELSKDKYEEAAAKDTCVKETSNGVTGSYTVTVTSRENKYCLE
ncbi:hypothetical protein MB27_10955 [Actinoplanes utahensis]|uniref:Uncharacterized protein n=1 Tax=Actinoplanes utahensis TaxID=1869 RepID=A0A0A6XBU6_ACTUT|nr:hypothetical protein MB27_10955 [Actinoplanes utahensis]